MTADEILNAPNLRSPLVAESIRCWQSAARLPLDVIAEFNWPFTEGVNGGGRDRIRRLEVQCREYSMSDNSQKK